MFSNYQNIINKILINKNIFYIILIITFILYLYYTKKEKYDNMSYDSIHTFFECKFLGKNCHLVKVMPDKLKQYPVLTNQIAVNTNNNNNNNLNTYDLLRESADINTEISLYDEQSAVLNPNFPPRNEPDYTNGKRLLHIQNSGNILNPPNKDYSITNPNHFHQSRRQLESAKYNEPHLIGYIYSGNTANNLTYPLLRYWNKRKNRYSYVYQDKKMSSDFMSFRPIELPNNTYELYDEDKITVLNQVFIVKLYDIKIHGLPQLFGDGTRHNYQAPLREFALLEPVNPLALDDNIRLNDDRYLGLYEQEIDTKRDKYMYYVKDRYNVMIPLNRTKKLYNDDIIEIPEKKAMGEFKIVEIKMAH
jgi:hypothetical protein